MKLKPGMTVIRHGIRASLILIYSDAPYAKVLAFPQDWPFSETRYQKWPIDEIKPHNSHKELVFMGERYKLTTK